MIFHDEALRWAHSGLARALSLCLGLASALFILVGPQYIARGIEELEHGRLSLLMVAMCLLFVHGVGFRFRSLVMQWLISPLVLWPASVLLFFITLQFH